MKISLLIKQAGSAPNPDPNHKPHIAEIRKSYCIIGRADSTVILGDVRCSRQHCLLYENHQRELCLKDLGSTNGTFVNGSRAQETQLGIGDEIRIGKTLILVLDYKPARDASLPTMAPPAPVSGPAAPTPDPDADHEPTQTRQDQTQTNTGIITTGPEKFFQSLSPQDRAHFIDYVDEEGTQTSIPLSKLLKSAPKKPR